MIHIMQCTWEVVKCANLPPSHVTGTLSEVGLTPEMRGHKLSVNLRKQTRPLLLMSQVLVLLACKQRRRGRGRAESVAKINSCQRHHCLGARLKQLGLSKTGMQKKSLKEKSHLRNHPLPRRAARSQGLRTSQQTSMWVPPGLGCVHRSESPAIPMATPPSRGYLARSLCPSTLSPCNQLPVPPQSRH